MQKGHASDCFCKILDLIANINIKVTVKRRKKTVKTFQIKFSQMHYRILHYFYIILMEESHELKVKQCKDQKTS